MALINKIASMKKPIDLTTNVDRKDTDNSDSFSPSLNQSEPNIAIQK